MEGYEALDFELFDEEITSLCKILTANLFFSHPRSIFITFLMDSHSYCFSSDFSLKGAKAIPIKFFFSLPVSLYGGRSVGEKKKKVSKLCSSLLLHIKYHV